MQRCTKSPPDFQRKPSAIPNVQWQGDRIKNQFGVWHSGPGLVRFQALGVWEVRVWLCSSHVRSSLSLGPKRVKV